MRLATPIVTQGTARPAETSRFGASRTRAYLALVAALAGATTSAVVPDMRVRVAALVCVTLVAIVALLLVAIVAVLMR